MQGKRKRGGADGVLAAVRQGGAIKRETCIRLLDLLASKTSYQHHIAIEVLTGAVLKTIDNEDDAQETIRRLESLPGPIAPHQMHAIGEQPHTEKGSRR